MPRAPTASTNIQPKVRQNESCVKPDNPQLITPIESTSQRLAGQLIFTGHQSRVTSHGFWHFPVDLSRFLGLRHLLAPFCPLRRAWHALFAGMPSYAKASAGLPAIAPTLGDGGSLLFLPRLLHFLGNDFQDFGHQGVHHRDGHAFAVQGHPFAFHRFDQASANFGS